MRHPPSRRHLRILAVVALGFVMLLAVERFIGWPDWARVEHGALPLARP